jgi:integrase
MDAPFCGCSIRSAELEAFGSIACRPLCPDYDRKEQAQMPRTRGSGSIYKQKNSAIYWVKYYRNGQPFRESTHSTSKQEAGDFLKKRLGEIATGNFYGPLAERVNVSELAEDLLRDYRINERKSVDDVEARWRLHLCPFFGHMKASEVSSDLIARYVDARRQQKASNATINREMAALKRMFRLGLYSTPPKVNRVPKIPRLAENNIRKGFLEDGQFEKIIAHCPELWFRAIVEVGRTYGWRVGDLLQLRVRQVDLLAKVLRLEPGTTKNKEGREVSMTQNVFALLSACVSGKKPEDFVFTRPGGKPVRYFRVAWQNACMAAGVPNLLFHDLRRTAARNLRRAGVAEGVIMKIGGWRTRSVFERYAIVSQTDIAEAMRKLEVQQNGHSLGHSGEEEGGSSSQDSVGKPLPQ